MKIEALKLRLIRTAVEKHDGLITPTVHKKSFFECFTEHNGKLIFWYNTADKSTRLISAKINPEAN